MKVSLKSCCIWSLNLEIIAFFTCIHYVLEVGNLKVIEFIYQPFGFNCCIKSNKDNFLCFSHLMILFMWVLPRFKNNETFNVHKPKEVYLFFFSISFFRKMKIHTPITHKYLYLSQTRIKLPNFRLMDHENTARPKAC